MEYEPFLSHVAENLPNYFSSNPDFKDWLLSVSNGDSPIGREIADFLVLTLPHPRIDYYQSSDFNVIQKSVTGHTSQLADELGFFPV